MNDKIYDRTIFTNNGIKHFDLFFEDGGVPSETIIKRFLDILETEEGAVAIHCKAGLGRTGTCIALYLMKHYHFSAQESIGWLRVCRPGSVIGIQQHFLHDIQFKMWKMGEAIFKENIQHVRSSNESIAQQSDTLVSNFTGGPKATKPKTRQASITTPSTLTVVKTPKLTSNPSPNVTSSSLTMNSQGILLMQQKARAQQQANKIPQNGVQRPFILGTAQKSQQKTEPTLMPLSKSFSNVSHGSIVQLAHITPKKMTKSLSSLDWQSSENQAKPSNKTR